MKIFYFLFAVFLLFSCNRIKEKGNNALDNIVDIITEPSISEKRIVELYPELGKDEYEIKQYNGIQLDYLPGFYEFYFKYACDQNKVSDFICNMKVTSYTDIKPDSSCYLINDLARDNDLSENTFNLLNFFFEFEDLEDYEVLQSTKTPLTHTLIIDKSSQMIYHRIEEFRE